MNKWIKMIIGGAVVGTLAALASLLIGWVASIETLIVLSYAISLAGWVIATVGLVGFLVTKAKATSAQ